MQVENLPHHFSFVFFLILPPSVSSPDITHFYQSAAAVGTTAATAAESQSWSPQQPPVCHLSPPFSPPPLLPPTGCHQGFLAAVLAFPLGPVLIWVISTSVGASGGRLERMRSMVFWWAALSCSSVRIMCFILLSRDRKFSTLASSVWIFCLAAWEETREGEGQRCDLRLGRGLAWIWLPGPFFSTAGATTTIKNTATHWPGKDVWVILIASDWLPSSTLKAQRVTFSRIEVEEMMPHLMIALYQLWCQCRATKPWAGPHHWLLWIHGGKI